MAFTKIENADLNGIGVIGLPDQPGLSTAAMQAKFEETARSVVIPKHNGLIDELEDTTAAGNIGAVAPTGRTGATVQAILDDISAFEKIESGGTTFTASGADTFKINAGSNVTITPLASPDKGIQISSAGGGGGSTGDMLMSDYDSDGSVKTAGGIKPYVTTAISGKADTSSLATVATSGQYSDLTGTPSLATVATSGQYSDLTGTPTIPDELADLTDDATHRLVTDTDKTTWNGKSTVAWSQTITTGQKIATVTINGTPTDVYAPTGGGGGGGAVDSVNGQTGTVVLDVDDINDVVIATAADGDVLAYDSSATKWKNKTLSIPTVTDTYDGTSSNAMSGKAVKSAIDALDYSDSAVSGKYVSAVTETDGKISVTRADLPTITDTYDGTSSNGMSGKAVKSAIDALDVSDSAVSGQYVSQVSETNGKISVTRASLPSVPTISVEHSGTASITAVRKETVTINSTAYDVDGSVYMESTANSASFVFTNSTYILSTSAVDVYTDTWGDNPSSVVVDGSLHTCTVTFASAASRTVRIYIK